MLLQLNSVIVDADVTNRQEMAGFLGNYGVNAVAQFADTEQLASAMGRIGALHLVIVNLDPNPPEMLRRMAHLPRQYPHVSFFVMSQTLDANVLMQAMQCGVREFIPLPITEENFSATLD